MDAIKRVVGGSTGKNEPKKGTFEPRLERVQGPGIELQSVPTNPDSQYTSDASGIRQDSGEELKERHRDARYNLLVVENFWYKRWLANIKTHKKAAIVFCVAVFLALLGVILGVVFGVVKNSSPAPVSSATPISSVGTPVSVSVATASMTTSTETRSSGFTTLTTTTAATLTSPSPPWNVCDSKNFYTKVTFVGVYDPSVPMQLEFPGGTTGPQCCESCFGNTWSHRCNAWQWNATDFVGTRCTLVYDYPGPEVNETCPKGYPLVSHAIDDDGDPANVGGLGPCARG